jgi:hypothetical protein
MIDWKDRFWAIDWKDPRDRLERSKGSTGKIQRINKPFDNMACFFHPVDHVC